jgi:hypothetical protein
MRVPADHNRFAGTFYLITTHRDHDPGRVLWLSTWQISIMPKTLLIQYVLPLPPTGLNLKKAISHDEINYKARVQ